MRTTLSSSLGRNTVRDAPRGKLQKEIASAVPLKPATLQVELQPARHLKTILKNSTNFPSTFRQRAFNFRVSWWKRCVFRACSRRGGAKPNCQTVRKFLAVVVWMYSLSKRKNENVIFRELPRLSLPLQYVPLTSTSFRAPNSNLLFFHW